MNTFIALYRGINVGGKNSVSMQTLRKMHEALGHQEVKSYIQSGNVVFSALGTVQAISKKIAKAFGAQFGFATKVMVIAAERWNKIIEDNPYLEFAAKEPKKVLVAICEGMPDAKALALLLEKTGGPESFAIAEEVIYLYAPDGVGRSKFLAGLEKASGVAVTVRNWRTVEAVLRLAANDS
jgi:uncharacterized protein (DUF1697 family)